MIGCSNGKGKGSLVLENVIGLEGRKNEECNDDRGSYALGDGLDKFGKWLI